jgi:hypothetical protein
MPAQLGPVRDPQTNIEPHRTMGVIRGAPTTFSMQYGLPDPSSSVRVGVIRSGCASPLALGAWRCLERSEAPARRRRPNEVEGVEIRGLKILDRVGPHEDVAAIIRLRMVIDADDVEACLLQAGRCAASAAIEIERLHQSRSSY